MLGRMSENCTQSGMELLQLPNDDLLKIFSFLDNKSQLNTLLVCRRLIGKTYELYKDRELVVTSKSNLKRSQKLHASRDMLWNGNPQRLPFSSKQ
jgi:hypothetical protein